MKKLIVLASTLTFTTLAILSCKKTAEPVIPEVPKVTFAKIAPILKLNCVPCHEANSGANFDARKKHVDNFTIAKDNAATIADRIQRETTVAGFMPRGKAKLAQADIDLVKQWIADGLLEK
jgi:uncharacterized membrane protein